MNIVQIRKEFKKYLEELANINKLSKKDTETQYSDADYPRKHADELGIDYWDSFKDNNKFEYLLSALQNKFKKEGKSPITIAPYKRALNSFRNFIVEKYKGVENMLQETSVNYYWVCQGLQKEDKSFVLAPVDNVHHHKRVNELKIGDVVVNYFGQEIKAISKVVKEPEIVQISNEDWYKVVLDYKELQKPISKSQIKQIFILNNISSFKYGPFDKNYDYNQGYLFNFSKELLDLILGNNIKGNTRPIQLDIQPINQILYGPPGTGKTYNTVLKAMSIIDNTEYKDVSEEQYSALKTKFDEYKQAGQIEFVTFHQSYSYEEFVEGIKPDCKNNNLKYILQDGIFKKICKSAQELKELKTQYNFNFDNISAYKILIPDSELFDYCIENNCVAINWGKDIDISECNSGQEIENKIPTTYESRKQCISQLKIFKLWIDEDLKNGKDVIVIIPGSLNTIKGIAKINGEYIYNEDVENGQQQRSVEWIRKNINISSESIYNAKFVSPTITGMYNEKINKENFLKLINNTNVLNSKNAVLIIDEINRGNLSKIFGELITLIEEDKRENLTVTLPYSKDPFTVPKNLYIIGTMNTSDRSIASIDIALRRRFKFIEMMPNADLVPDRKVFDINLRNIFKKLNNRISVLLDRDHQIGHSYFMPLENSIAVDEDFKDIWFDSILPLLNEYFYNDWEKLCAILGKPQNNGNSFIKKIDNVSFANEYSCDDTENYDFISKNDEAFNFKVALENAFIDNKTKKEQEG